MKHSSSFAHFTIFSLYGTHLNYKHLILKRKIAPDNYSNHLKINKSRRMHIIENVTKFSIFWTVLYIRKDLHVLRIFC